MMEVPKTSSVEVRRWIVDTFRRDLVGPGFQDTDLAHERIGDGQAPSRWYLTGFLAPADDPLGMVLPDEEEAQTLAVQEELPIEADAPDTSSDTEPPEAPNTKRRFLPSSVGLTVLLPPDVKEIEAHISWGDYRTEPPLSEAILTAEDAPVEIGEDGKPKKIQRPSVEWVRKPEERSVRLKIKDGRGDPVLIPESAAAQYKGGALTLETHARLFTYKTAEGKDETVRVLTIFLVNRRSTVHRFYADVAYIFQARLELVCPTGFMPRRDMSGFMSSDWDLRIADLHYRDICEWAVGRNAAAGWSIEEEKSGSIKRVWTDPLPCAEVERVAPNEDAILKDHVCFGMEDLAQKAGVGGDVIGADLSELPALYGAWIEAERKKIDGKSQRRRETAERLIKDMEMARQRIANGINILSKNDLAREAFRFANLAVASAARHRIAGTTRDPSTLSQPTWRPFQLAFILLNITGLVDPTSGDREIADLLFFPTGGGKTEAYLGLAAFVIAYRRLTNSGLLGAGVAVIMRYTLRLLTLDQLTRAAGVICALELMRTDPKYADAKGQHLWETGQ